MNSTPTDQDHDAEHRSRDALTLKLLGLFFLAFGLLVWLGLFWDQSPEGRIVNICSGAALTISGSICLRIGTRHRKTE